MEVRMRYLALAVPALLLAVTLGCGKKKTSESGGVTDTSISVTTPPAAEAPVEARDFSFEERQAFAQSIRSQLAELDGRIAELSKEAKSKGGAVSDRALERIRADRKAVDRNLSKIASATAANWEKVKQATNQSVETVAEAVEAAMPK
jgi:TolA-binding protein